MSWTATPSIDVSPWARGDLWADTWWAARAFPTVHARARRVLGQVGEALSPHEASAIESSLSTLLGGKDVLVPLAALREYVGWLRGQTEHAPRLERLELTLVALDVTFRHLSPNPVLHAVDAMGWGRVPRSQASFVVALGLLIRQLRIGSCDVPKASRHETFEGVRRVAAIASEVAGVRSRLEWSRTLLQATKAAPKLGARWVGGGFVYLLQLLERLPQTEPSNLEVYEALADEAEHGERVGVERAMAVYADALGPSASRASMELRAAIRRLAASDGEGAREHGRRAYAQMSACGDRAGSCCAAVLLVDAYDADDASWLERAWVHARGNESRELQQQLVGMLGMLRRHTGDELGARRFLWTARGLVDPEDWEVYLDLWWPDADEELVDESEEAVEAAPVPEGFGAVRRIIRRGRLVEAYEELGGAIGDLLARLDHATVACMLLEHARGHGAAFDARLLAAWSCAAAADLVPHDRQVWCEAKALQLTLEDELGLTEEHFVSGMQSFVQVTGPRLRAAQCIEEGERAMREGEAWKARFWLDRAQHYRALMG